MTRTTGVANPVLYMLEMPFWKQYLALYLSVLTGILFKLVLHDKFLNAWIWPIFFQIFSRWIIFFIYSSVFQPFSIRGTSCKFIITWQNLNVPYSTIFNIFREPRNKLAEPRLKNTDLQDSIHHRSRRECILGRLCHANKIVEHKALEKNVHKLSTNMEENKRMSNQIR